MSHPDNTQEEPQEVRGSPGSRDAGGDGPVDRPVGSSDASDHTGVDPQDPIDPASPTLRSGGA